MASPYDLDGCYVCQGKGEVRVRATEKVDASETGAAICRSSTRKLPRGPMKG